MYFKADGIYQDQNAARLQLRLTRALLLAMPKYKDTAKVNAYLRSPEVKADYPAKHEVSMVSKTRLDKTKILRVIRHQTLVGGTETALY